MLPLLLTFQASPPSTRTHPCLHGEGVHSPTALVGERNRVPDPDPKGAEIPPAALADEPAGARKEQSENPSIFAYIYEACYRLKGSFTF